MKTQPIRGFRDFLPEIASVRKLILNKFEETFKIFGFAPLETPALEFAEVLKGKYGEDEKLIYEFSTKGGDRVAMRYDQTVPLARVIASYPDLPKPFKRYQIQPVWRGENPQKGRFREFLQCDIDIVGAASVLADAEIISCVLTATKNLGFKDAFMEINDRIVFSGLEPKYIAAVDKLKKIGKDGVIAELAKKGMRKSEAEICLGKLLNQKETSNIKDLFKYLENLGFKKDKDFKFSPTLARGLDYYTGVIFELISPSYGKSSLGGGGRYDKLLGFYSGIDYPATGFAFGFDRIVEAVKELNLVSFQNAGTKVLVTVFSPELLINSLNACSKLRSAGIQTEIWLEPTAKLVKQLKYADQKNIPYVLIIGPDEARKNQVTLKNLKIKSQSTFSINKLSPKLFCI